jgi:hypothetical protein
MKTFEFEKQGIKFYFRNPELNDYGELVMQYKIENIKENKENDGYFHNSKFIPYKNAMSFFNVKINNKKVDGVGLPDNILTEVKQIHEQLKQADLHHKITRDIPYTLNDTTAYGIYNGISQFDIEPIINNIKERYNTKVFIFAEDIAKKLNKDKELKQIAIDTYQPNPECNNWNDEYLTWFRSAVKEKQAPGHGNIPNAVIREKISVIILKEMEKELQNKQVEEKRINELFEKAKQTGEKQLLNKWSEPCNDPKEECNVDIVYVWIMPDGSKTKSRHHTW